MAHLAHTIWRANRHKGLWPWLAALALATLVIGCGGGGGDTASNGVGVGGTGGPVSGYGSIIVNNVRFDFAGASFTTEDVGDDNGDEPAPSPTGEQPVGMGTMVLISSDRIRDDGVDKLATAKRITLVSAIRGPVQQVSGNTLTVLGQQVDVDAATWYTPGHELAALDADQNQTPSQKVVVYADLVAGRYKATRIEYRDNMLVYKVRGRVANLGSNSFSLGGITIDTSTTPGGMPSLSNGLIVRVLLAPVPVAANTYRALRVAPIGASLTEGQELSLSGVATAVSLAGVNKTCKIDGVTVDLSKLDLTNVTLNNDSRVELEGTVVNGVLVASEINVKSDATLADERSRIKLIGSMTAWAPGNGCTGIFTVKAFQVRYTSGTQITASGNGSGGCASLANNRLVEVEGQRDLGDPTLINATRIRLR